MKEKFKKLKYLVDAVLLKMERLLCKDPDVVLKLKEILLEK